MCSICCSDSCNCDGISQVKGDAGQPAFIEAVGHLATNATANWIEAGRFIFSKDIATIFTSIRVNVWVSAGTGGFRIKDLVTGNVIYTNSVVTSTSVINIETRKALQIYNSTSAIIAVETQGSGANTVSIASAIFAYEK